MNEKNQIAISVEGNIEGYKKANDAALAEQRRFGEQFERNEQTFAQRQAQREADVQRRQDEAERKWMASKVRLQLAMQETSASYQEAHQEAEKFVQKLKDQAATLGLSGSELQRYRASQMQLTDEQKKSVATSIEQIETFERSQSMIKSITAVVGRAVAAYASLEAARRAVTKAVTAAHEAELSEARFNAVYRATGGSAGFSRAELGDTIDEMTRKTRFGDEEIRDAMTRLMTFRQVSGSAFREAMLGAAGLADVMGGSLVNAAESLGAALQNPEAAMMRLTHAGVSLTQAQKEAVKELVEHGRQAEAMTIILQAMRDSGFMSVSEEINKPGGYTHSISAAGKAVNEAFEALGKTSAIKTPVVGTLDAVARALTNLKQILENGTWYERLLMLTPSPAKFYWLFGREPGTAGAGDPNAPEAAAARRAAQEAQWQASFDTQRAGPQKFIDKQNEQDARRAQTVQAEAARRFVMDSQRALEEEARAPELAQGHWMEDLRKATEAATKESDAITRRREALEREADAVKAAIDPYEKYSQQIEKLDKLQRAGLLTSDQFAAVQDKAINELGENLGWLEKKGTDTFKELKDAAEGWGRDTSRAFARMALDGRYSFETLGNAARRFAEELLAMHIQRNMMDPALRAGTSFLENLFRPGALPDASVQTGAYGGMDASAIAAMQLHGGGVVGRDGSPRFVHPAYFERAPRLHSGGLLPNERPAILQTDEEVLTRRDPRHRWNGGGAPSVTVNLVNQSGVPVQAEAAAPRFDGESVVVDLVLTRLARDGAARDQMRSMLAGPPNY